MLSSTSIAHVCSALMLTTLLPYMEPSALLILMAIARCCLLRSDILDIYDLKEGMELKGTVRNVIDFGAFVDAMRILGEQNGLIIQAMHEDIFNSMHRI